jgi:hypothetical protein
MQTMQTMQTMHYRRLGQAGLRVGGGRRRDA